MRMFVLILATLAGIDDGAQSEPPGEAPRVTPERANPSTALTLEQAIAECLAIDPVVRAQAQLVTQAEGDLKTASLAPNPGFAALFGVSIMNGVLLVKSITTLRAQGDGLEVAIVNGAQNCLRPILMASLVAVLGLLPASVATGLGSDVQRPLATVIVWGLLSATLLTLVVVPVFYRVFSPPLPGALAPSELEARFVEPLPDVAPQEIVALLDYLAPAGGEEEIFKITEQTRQDFSHLLIVVKAAELLGFVETPRQTVVLTPVGRGFLGANTEGRKAVWCDRLLGLRLFQEVRDLLQAAPSRSVRREDVLETIMSRMPHEDPLRVFNTFIRWSRFGELFRYDEASQLLSS
jgi:hypothetical protein